MMSSDDPGGNDETQEIINSSVDEDDDDSDTIETRRRRLRERISTPAAPRGTENNDGAIIHNIASFLALSDAASIASGWGVETPTNQDSGSWGVGDEIGWMADVTPPAPGLIAVSPVEDGAWNDDEDLTSVEYLEEIRKNVAQEKLASAIFWHPDPLRNFCVDAFQAARAVKEHQVFSSSVLEVSPETLVEPCSSKQQAHLVSRRRPSDHRILLLSTLLDHLLFHNVPLSVLLDVTEGTATLFLDTTFSVAKITNRTIAGLVHSLVRLVQQIWHTVTHLNPLELVQRPFNAFGKTTEVVVSGIQSVATGVGSASSLAFHRLPAKTGSSQSLGQQGSLRRNLSSPRRHQHNKKLLKKLSTLNSAASVISYTETADDTGGLSRHAKSRVQKMMHYEVSLRPFLATVKLPIDAATVTNGQPRPSASLMPVDAASSLPSTMQSIEDNESQEYNLDGSSVASSPVSTGFMCTPQSFPPTPAKRKMVLAKGNRFADDVLYLARDQLRVHDALASEDERTREMAMALTTGKRLAIFNANDASSGIEFSCGQHVATKVGNMLYCSTRSMVPILRNCFVYFEMTVKPRTVGNLIPQASKAALSVGLSTKEMPPDTLVGAWKGSVGLCTTGQMLSAGQWCSPVDPTLSAFGDRATVGCLVCLDDDSDIQTWDGVMVTTAITFNVDERFVSPPVSSLPMAPGVALSGLPDLPGSPQAAPGHPASASFTLQLLVPAQEELYPTVTLNSPGTSVMCRFNAGDVLATTRAKIGAPPGVPVYAVDGSVILDETQD